MTDIIERPYTPDDQDDGRMSIVEHLAELRNRILWSLGSLAVGSAIAFGFSKAIFDALKLPLGDFPIQQIDPTEAIGVYFQICILAGFVLSLPMHIYQIVMFVAPGLLPHEKRLLFTFLPFTLVSFVTGVLFGYFVLLPPALQFLLGFGPTMGIVDVTEIRVSSYYDLILRLMFWIGIVFLTPVVMLLLGRLGILSYDRIAPFRRYAYVIAFILAAMITPTIDPVNMVLVAGPLTVLFEVGAQLVRIFGKKRDPFPAA